MTAISDKYTQLGGAAGFLGAAVGPESIPPDGVGRFRHYQRGSIYWHPSTGAHSIQGSIRQRWADLGWETGPLGYPTSDEEAMAPGGRKSKFQFGLITWHPNPLTEFKVHAQNMALLVAPGTYLGTERGKAIAKIIDVLKTQQPHVVGLSECFANDERAKIKAELKNIYPATLEGPDEDDLESDGGLLLLSRFPILESHATIYRQTVMPDGLANKGALHARVQVPGLPFPMDFFLTHTQDPDAGGTDQARGALQKQLIHLQWFINACRQPNAPALLIGDINTDLNNSLLHQDLDMRLHNPIDVWAVAGNKVLFPLGITEDKAGSFISGRPLSPPTSVTRHKTGKRLDGLLAYNGLGIWPGYGLTQVVVDQSSNGRDISDHYGLRTVINSFQSLPVTVTRPIAKVTVSLHHFFCLEESDEVGDDTAYFFLTCKSQNGQTKTGKSGKREGVATGELHTVAAPVSHQFTDPGQFLDIEVKGMEYDATSSDDWLGTSTIRVSRQELLEMHHRTVSRIMPRLTRDGGEYAVMILIKVE